MRISVSLGEELMDELKQKAESEGARSLASIIREALEMWLERNK